MTAAQLDLPPAAPAGTDPAELPGGARLVYKRAVAAGFTVSISYGSAVIDKGVRQPLLGEDGQALTTDKGNPRCTIVKVATIVASIALRLQHDEHQQGQAGWWVDDKPGQAWAWPSDGSDIRRTIAFTQLGTLVDLAELADQSLATARDVVAHLEHCPDCQDYTKASKHLEST